MTDRISPADNAGRVDPGAAADQFVDYLRPISEYRSPGVPIADGDIVSWILGDGRRLNRGPAFFDELCWRLVGAGLPLWRAAASVGTLHPQILGHGYRWWRQRKLTEEFRIERGVDDSPDYLESPIRRVIEEGITVRYRLDGTAPGTRFPLLESLRQAGATDYLAAPLTFFNGRHQTVSWTTDRPEGFTDADIAMVCAILPAAAAVVEGKAMRRLATSLLDIYLGPTIGQHILNGEVMRGQGKQMRAVLMATDLRGFTSLSDRLPAGELIALLDEYFDAVAAPVQVAGGEILKFVGDGVLAIFPINGGAEPAAAAAAIAAGEGCLARLGDINRRRRAHNKPLINTGIGLHIGDFTYGNVGAADRLDFTAIGPAVNLACRLEAMTKRLERPLLASHDFAAVCPRPLLSLGFQPVRGIRRPEEVFGLPAA